MNPMKDFFLCLSRQKLLQKMLSTSGPFKVISRRFVAGETLHEGFTTSKKLNGLGIDVTLDQLGESVTDGKMALEVLIDYFKIIEQIQSEDSFRISISLKLTQLGLDIGYDFCLDNMRRLMQEAKKHDKMVTIDMEDSPYTDRTLNIYKTLFKEGFCGMGIVIQAYLRRSEQDIRNLLPLGPRVRLCKGAYKEPSNVAFTKKSDVDSNYLKLLEILFSPEALKSGTYPEVATHDERIINWVLNYAKDKHIGVDKFEFQMLYGIRRDLQERLVKDGFRMRVYLPFGTHWYPYFMRRLAERPANCWFLAKNVCRIR